MSNTVKVEYTRGYTDQFGHHVKGSTSDVSPEYAQYLYKEKHAKPAPVEKKAPIPAVEEPKKTKAKAPARPDDEAAALAEIASREDEEAEAPAEDEAPAEGEGQAESEKAPGDKKK